MPQKKRQRLMDLLVADPMVIFQKQKYFVVYICQIIYQGRQYCSRVDEEAFLNQVNRRLPYFLARALYSVTHIEDKSRGLVIVRINGQPGDGISAVLQFLQPGRDEGGLPKPCWSFDDCEALSGELRGYGKQAGPRDQPLASGWNDLGRDEILPRSARNRAFQRDWLTFRAR